MIDKLLNLVYPSQENFLSLVVPTLFTIALVVLIWIGIFYLTRWIQLKSDQWLANTAGGILDADASLYKRFVVTYLSSIKKTLFFFRIFIAAHLILNLISNNCKTISIALIDSNKSDAVFDTKIVSMYFDKFSTVIENASYTLIYVFIVVTIAVWLIKALQYLVHTLLKHTVKSKSFALPARVVARRKTLNSVTNTFLKAVVTVLALFTILQNFGVNIAALLATAGIASISFAFGAQAFLRDFISGFFIVLEDQFAVGDQVEINSISGTVESMTFRILKLRTGEGSITIVPNGEIKTVRNFSTDWSQVEFKILLPINTSVPAITRILYDETITLKNDFETEIIDKPDIRSAEKILNFENKANSLQFRVFIKTANTKDKIKIESEFNKRILSRLQAENIKLL